MRLILFGLLSLKVLELLRPQPARDSLEHDIFLLLLPTLLGPVTM